MNRCERSRVMRRGHANAGLSSFGPSVAECPTPNRAAARHHSGFLVDHAVERASTIRHILEYAFMVVLMLSAHSVYFKISNAYSAVFEIALLAIALLLVLYAGVGRLRADASHIAACGVVLALISAGILLILQLVHGDDNLPSYMMQRAAMWMGIVPVCAVMMATMGFEYASRVFLPKFATVLGVSCAVGLMIWAGANLGVIQAMGTVQYQWGGTTSAGNYFMLVLSTQWLDTPFAGLSLFRFTLFYIETPVAVVAFALGLVIELFLREKPRVWVCLVLTVSIMCSFGTTGIILVPAIWLLWAVQSDVVRFWVRRYSVAAWIYCVSILAAVVAIPAWAVLSVSAKTNVTSRDAHFADIVTGLDAFVASPITGHGIGNYQTSIADFSPTGRANQTSGLLSTVTQGGMLLLSLYLAAFVIVMFHAYMRRSFALACVGVVAFVLFFLVIIDNNPLLAVMLSFFYSFALDGSGIAGSGIAGTGIAGSRRKMRIGSM